MKTIVYDAATNMVMKGEVEISDRLTAAEYRLLLFCIENQERIIERDEIITNVWKIVPPLLVLLTKHLISSFSVCERK